MAPSATSCLASPRQPAQRAVQLSLRSTRTSLTFSGPHQHQPADQSRQPVTADTLHQHSRCKRSPLPPV